MQDSIENQDSLQNEQNQEQFEDYSINENEDSQNNSSYINSNEPINNYIIKETIGSGTFAKVKLCLHIPTNTTYAIKILIKSKIPETDLIFIQRELLLLKELSHPNIIKLIEIFETPERYFIVTEFCENGELYNIIVNNQRLSNDVAALFYYQLINGLECIHNKNIAHRDIKPENLLITQNKFLKIIDFGLSNYLPEDGLLETPCGSPCYASPEMVSGNKYEGIKHDIWSTGVVLYAMLCGYLPFEEENNDLLFKKIIACDLEYPSFLHEDAKALMMKILVQDCDERLSIEQIKEEPFYLLGKQIYNDIENLEGGISLLCDNDNNNNNNLEEEELIPLPLIPNEVNNEEQPLICEEIPLPNDDGLRDTILPGHNIREVFVNFNTAITNNNKNDDNDNNNKNVSKNGDNIININSSNNIKPKISSKTKTTPSKTNNTSSSNKPHKKVTNTSASKTPQEYEKNKRNNNSYKKPKQIIIDDNNIIPNPSLRKNSKCLINNNFSKKTEISNRSNTKRKHKDKKQHYITGYANQQKLILQYQQKPKMNSFVKIITQNPITSSKSRNNSSTKVKTKTIIKTFSNHKHINNSNNSNKLSSLNHLMKQHLKKTPSKLTSTPLPLPFQGKSIITNTSKERKSEALITQTNHNNKRTSSPNMHPIKHTKQHKRNINYKNRPKESIQKFLTNKQNVNCKKFFNQIDSNNFNNGGNNLLQKKEFLFFNLNSPKQSKRMSSTNKHCSLKKPNKRSDHKLEFGNIRSATEHNEYSLNKQQHRNFVTTQENLPINFYCNNTNIFYRNNNNNNTNSNIYSKSGNLSNSTGFKYIKNNKNPRTANTTVTISKKPSSMRAHEHQKYFKNKKCIINSLRYKNNSVRTYIKDN